MGDGNAGVASELDEEVHAVSALILKAPKSPNSEAAVAVSKS